MKKILMVLGILLLSVVLVLANGDHQSEIEEGKKLVESGVGCNNLNDEQLEAIGDYYMEQMHPGEAHKMMDNMMGGEGSESLKQVHINMAKRLYCDEDIGGMMDSGGMMEMMNMMGGGMMGSYPAGYYAYRNYGYWNIFWILLFAVVVFLIAWVVYKFGIKKTVPEMPLNILKNRFVKGEITKKEFDSMKKEIGE